MTMTIGELARASVRADRAAQDAATEEHAEYRRVREESIIRTPSVEARLDALTQARMAADAAREDAQAAYEAAL